MKTNAATLRNLAFIGHPSSGKTTLVDALAFELGVAERKGSVADKTSICDTEPEEQDKGHTLQLSVVHANKDGKAWNLIDTPGYPDFMAETLSGMHASDCVVAVVSATSGVTFNLLKKLEAAEALGLGRIIVVTHVDGEHADFNAVVEELRSKVGEICVPLDHPDQSGPGFSKVLCALDEEIGDWKKRTMDRVMDNCDDEELLMSYLDGQELTREELDRQMPIAIAKGTLIPIVCCNPESGLGIHDVLEFLEEFAPTPISNPRFVVDGEVVEPDNEGKLLGLVFSVRADPHVGRICAARILHGTLRASDLISNGKGKGEKPGGLFALNGGKNRTPVEECRAGDIVAFSKVEHIGHHDCFSTDGDPVHEVEFPDMPTPTVSLAITPRTSKDEQKIGEALHKLEAEDPSFRIDHNPLTHELVMNGMSELHLAITEARLERRYGVQIDTHLPRIAYQETVTKEAEGHHRHKKQSGGRGQFAECQLRVRPGAPGSGVVFLDKVVGGSIPRNYIPAVEKGIHEICSEGILTHSQVVDVEVELFDGKYHAVDSDEASFKVAGKRAFMEAFEKAGPVLLEPMMKVEIHAPIEDAGTIFSDLTSQRRGQVLDQASEEGGHIAVIEASVPLANMQTYQRDLKSQTAGEGSFSMSPRDYAPMPMAEQKRVLADAAKVHDHD
ncbi:MAG: elongation factor G [Planctomycetota bacterium]|nr:elongation factor G [Planctomycetota bacterium]